MPVHLVSSESFLFGRGDGGGGGRTYVALAADHLIAVELAGQSFERGFDDTATETEDEMECRFLLPHVF